MMNFRWIMCIMLLFAAGCAREGQPPMLQAAGTPVPHARTTPKEKTTMETTRGATPEIVKSEEEWKKQLTPEQYHVLREKGTERAFTGKYWNLKDDGTYTCAGCGEVLFKSDTKFDSGCGWPSFFDAADNDKIVKTDDFSYGMRRIEVTCRKCGGHLGHVFEDGPNPTGLRYCINSASINFRKAAEQPKK